MTPRLYRNPRVIASDSESAIGSLDTVPVGTLPRNGFCCCPASELGVVLFAAGLMVRGVAILPSSKDAAFCWAVARGDSPVRPAITMVLQMPFNFCSSRFIIASVSSRGAAATVRFGHQRQNQSAQSHPAEHMEAIQRAKKRRLLIGQAGHHTVGLFRGVGGA